jgi:hypothetical protein
LKAHEPLFRVVIQRHKLDGMKTGFAEEQTATKSRYWRELVAEQERSGLSVHRFCEERGLTEASFYSWRKRLGKREPVKFALVETGRHQATQDAGVELVLTTGERLRINAGVDAVTLRTVLEVLRG